MFAWAGLWSNSEEWGRVYTCVMTSCAAELAYIHDRSPVIISQDRWQTWLSAPLSELGQFDQPWPAADVTVTSTDVPWKFGGEPERLPA